MNDRRHELQQNDLAIYLDRINKVIEPHSKVIAVVIGGLIVAGLAWMLYNGEQTSKRSYSTFELIEAMNSNDTEILAGVSEKFPGTLASEWAKLYQANQFLTEGVDALFADRDNAVTLLGDAKKAYENALVGATDPLLISRGHFGLARAHESLGELDEAIAQYKETIAVGESDEMTEKAEERIAALGKPGTKSFLAWFADQDFSPSDPSLPPSLPGSASLPDLPDLDLPDLNLPGGENSTVMESDEGLELPADDGAETGVKEEASETADEAKGEEVKEDSKAETASAE
ncbi:YfgM family protein [Rubripirellula reticaptiva]|uniref:Uncharacterized protein n=1 Tax=Rubripirellula reticaptiva TaxID=2528013 RepID=A0A5C6EJ97_9BACT|nr:tetratricopeptide repeat protein [Rubripirellula reticaptiva]TWU47726.1 hypothetical protein Poly59_45670 [Rubripirellula reticaptiva]